MKKPRKTFSHYADLVLHLKKSRSINTYKHALVFYRVHLNPYFGKMLICEITQFTIDKFLADKSEKMKTYDLTKHLKRVFKVARMSGESIHEMEIKPIDVGVGRSKIYSDKEVFSLLKSAKKLKLLDMHLQIRMAYHMGMRRGEITHLEWAMINFQSGWIYLPPWFIKTKRTTDRAFPMNKEVFVELKKRYFLRENEKRVFPVRDNRKQFKKIQNHCGVYGRFHDLRHTCATRMLNAGIPEKIICKMLGMSSDVLSRYAHVVEEIAIKAVNL